MFRNRFANRLHENNERNLGENVQRNERNEEPCGVRRLTVDDNKLGRGVAVRHYVAASVLLRPA